MTKNDTRIASLLGTWTGQTHLKTDIGSYELMAYFAVHIMPDPMRAYACSLPGCSEEKNQACMLEKKDGNTTDTDTDANDGTGTGTYGPTCKNLPDTVLDWSDVTAFMYFGARVDVGFPFNKHRGQDTGGWVGPLNLIMAQQEEEEEDLNSKTRELKRGGTKARAGAGAGRVVDRYVARYVETPSTQYLYMPKNCTLLKEHDFQKLAGPNAVKSTVRGQYSEDNHSDDPYAKYLKTCSNGEVEPMLPKIEFEFVQNDNGSGGDDGGGESINVKMNYKLLVVPKKTDYVYHLFPMIQRRFNKAGFGFEISGPYCYEDDPKRGYTFDLDFESSDSNGFLKFQHACVEGLPCTPPSAELYVESQNSSIDVKPLPDDATTVGLGKYVAVGIIIGLLFSTVLCLYCNNRKLKRQLRDAQEDVGTGADANVDVDVTRASEAAAAAAPGNPNFEVPTPYEAMEMEDMDAHEHEHSATSGSEGGDGNGEQSLEEGLIEQSGNDVVEEGGNDDDNDETQGLLLP